MVHRRRIPRPRTGSPGRSDVATRVARPDVAERDPSRRARRASEEAEAYLAAHRRQRRELRPGVR